MSTHDTVVRLRIWGSEEVFALEPDRRYLVGGDAECEIRIENAAARCQLSFARDAWIAHGDAIELDGERRTIIELAPLVELGIGGVVLVAESARASELHALLQRWLGWSEPTRSEHALRAIRDGIAGRAALAISGADARAFGAAIHRITGGDAPLAVATIRDLLAIHRRWSRIATIEVPGLAAREPELERLGETAVQLAIAELAADPAAQRPRDPAWLRSRSCNTLSQLDDVARRLVAIRTWGVTHGAARLGISHGALSRWAVRQRLAT